MEIFGGQNVDPNELVFSFGGSYAVPNLVKIDQEMRPWTLHSDSFYEHSKGIYTVSQKTSTFFMFQIILSKI